MSWLARNNFTAGEAMSHAYLNNLANDIRAWGGDVNAGSYSIANLKSITGVAGNIGIGVSPGACALDLYSGGVLWTNAGPIYELFNSSDRVIQVRSATQSVVNLVSDVSADEAVIGGVYFGRTAGQSDAHISIAGIRGLQDGTGLTAGSALAFIVKSIGSPYVAARLDRSGFGVGVAPICPLTIFGNASGMIAKFQPSTAIENQRSYVSLYTTNDAYWWDVSLEDTSGGGTLNGLAFRERSGSGSSVVRMYLHQGGGVSIYGLPTHADNAAALGAGLTAGRMYRTSAGVLGIVY